MRIDAKYSRGHVTGDDEGVQRDDLGFKVEHSFVGPTWNATMPGETRKRKRRHEEDDEDDVKRHSAKVAVSATHPDRAGPALGTHTVYTPSTILRLTL